MGNTESKLRKIICSTFNEGKLSGKISEQRLKYLFNKISLLVHSNEEKEAINDLYRILVCRLRNKNTNIENMDMQKIMNILRVINRTDVKNLFKEVEIEYDLNVYGEMQGMLGEAFNAKGNDKCKGLLNLLHNGDIITKLEGDTMNFDGAQMLITKQSYLSYINGGWKTWDANELPIARLINLSTKKMYLVGIAVIGNYNDNTIVNMNMKHLKITDNLGFRVVNFEDFRILKTETYSDIKRIIKSIYSA